ncbi:RNase RNM [Thalassotalea aquiviva]|uniref:RNase RNM n=1 Tax=Thalassotalea aquiviva TaxID=3242415 RepID=UPI00352B193E
MSEKNQVNMEPLRVDLHSHTNCSDGHLTPQELIDRACNYQLDQLAITDHDTVSGFEQASQYINENQLPLTLISGIEISTLWQNFEIHIVGLGLDVKHPKVQALISRQQQSRELRAQLMAEKLAKAGFEDCLLQAQELAQDGSITRAHFARVLQHRGVVNTMQKAFDKYIGKGRRAYVKPQWCRVDEAVDVIKAAGGYSVIAHPLKYDLSTKWLRRLIIDFKDVGGDAMEVASCQLNQQQRKLLIELCHQYDLQGSIGSDFHFPTPWSDLGRNLTLPEPLPLVWQNWTQ